MRSASRAGGDRGDTGHEQRPMRLDAVLTASENNASGGEPRSSYGTIPGDEFPAFVYVSVLAAFAWIMLASWVAFAADMDAALSLGFAVVLGIVLFALPIIIREVAAANAGKKHETTGEFLSAPVETATGPLRGSSAWLQVLIIPASLALAATLIGAAFILAR